MKKIISFALAIMLIATMSVTAFAADNTLDNERKTGTTEVTHTVSDSYIVTIPDSMTIGTDANVSVKDVVLASDQELTVSVSSAQYNDGWKLKNGGDTIGYTLKIDNTDVANNGTVLTVKSGETATKTLKTELSGTAKYSGTYTDRLTFTVAVVTVNETYSYDATTASDDELKTALTTALQAGKTDIEITLPANADSTMFTTIAEALGEGAADGTVCLTINGATDIPKHFLAKIGDSDPIYPSAKIKKIVLTDATSIGNEAFYICENLISVDAPQATTIGDFAFQFCTSLTSVNLPKATTISKSAFEYCTTLTTLNLPLANSLGGSFICSSSSLTELRLTATGTISVTTDATIDFHNTFSDASTTKIDLYLNIDKQSEVTNDNTWNGCVFKSITFVDTNN